MASTKKVSKTAKASMPSKGGGKYEASGEIPRLIPCGGGQYAYVLDMSGRTRHAKVGDAVFLEAVGTFTGSALESRVLALLEKMIATYPQAGWETGVAKLRGDSEPAGGDDTAQG